MTDTPADPAVVAPPNAPSGLSDAAASLHATLIDSRHRWQNFLDLAADIAFETDANGRFVFLAPEEVLGWPAAKLIGEPSELLMEYGADDSAFNPFRTGVKSRGRRMWVRRYDGSMAHMGFSTTPVLGHLGQVVGTRGVAVDVSEYQVQAARTAGSLRRGEVLDYILWGVSQEVLAPRMMAAALSSLTNALTAEGATVVVSREPGRAGLLHETGGGPPAVRETAVALVERHGAEPSEAITPDGHLVLAVGCQTRFGENAGLAVWRSAGSRPWDRDDILLARSAASIIRMILEHEAIQQEMGRQARTDPLTGLLNRRAFLEEMQRHVVRLDQENLPGTLMFVDMDAFKAVNDQLGHEMGDQTLVHVAQMLRDLVRPSDLIARLGGDEFAVWMGGADHMTAAERADYLRKNAPQALHALLERDIPGLGLSIGIATRRAGSEEAVEDLIKRADVAMYQVKRGGRGHWRVSLLEGD